MTIDVVERLSEADLRVIDEGLTRHAASFGVVPRDHKPLHVLARDDGQHIVGGLVGATVWGWLEVKLLWVSEHCRGRGYGTRLLRAAEAEARRRGCHHALLDTFDFQARGFYEALGYRAFGRLDDFPREHSRFFLEKVLG